MKTTTIAVAALLAGFAATAARAESRVHVGINVNTAPGYRTEAPAYYPPSAAVIPPTAYPIYAPNIAPRGYWTDVTVKTWVPDRWNTGRDRWGRPVQMLERGHFAYMTNRVWVDGRNDGRNDRWDGRYGYNRNNDRR